MLLLVVILSLLLLLLFLAPSTFAMYLFPVALRFYANPLFVLREAIHMYCCRGSRNRSSSNSCLDGSSCNLSNRRSSGGFVVVVLIVVTGGSIWVL